ncbi:TenA family protein [Mangrovibacterium diazotrophicum]|uniref:Thiaminase/transcriptional activator TenA n=1 Tax=Mangrovibacterium diazotrophicum TaxID=1261403 RepID=A0A419W337_9BACT|nr:TenA family protein [Mangrovibacterium diazotrophicum]RKD89895.1 thiaminase/transcriptional activator TenA [Mangrovibacterium diazotrophicum]
MTWSEEAWAECNSVFTEITKLPFLHELMDGSLPNEKFLFYLRQDAFYLAEYGKILAAIAARLDQKEWREAFLGFSGDTVAVEQALHQFYLKDQLVDAEPTPTNLLYTGHMWRQLAAHSTEEALASVLPCFWVYKEVGDFILANQAKGENPYQSWIDTYGGDEFAKAVAKALFICDKYAEKCTPAQRERMTAAFKLAFKMEWMFWQSAYEQEQWRV